MTAETRGGTSALRVKVGTIKDQQESEGRTCYSSVDRDGGRQKPIVHTRVGGDMGEFGTTVLFWHPPLPSSRWCFSGAAFHNYHEELI